MKGNTLAQWRNLHQNNSFVNPTDYLYYVKNLVLGLVGLTAGWPAGRQSDKILVDLMFSIDHIVRIFMEFNEGTVLL